MKPLFILAGLRSPFCRSGTSLAGCDAAELGRSVVQALITTTGIDPGSLTEVIFGCVSQPADTANIARVIALRAGIPEHVPAATVHRNCGSGLEALTTAAERMAMGKGDLFIVGGVESMSNMPLLFPRSAAGKFAALAKAKSFPQKLRAMFSFRPADFRPVVGLRLGLTDPVVGMNMGETAELLAREFSLSRDNLDEFALLSQRRAAAAKDKLAEEITPIYTGTERRTVVAQDNGVRADSSLEALARLKPIFEPAHGVVTAGNSSQVSDGAVALLVGSEEQASKLGLKPLGQLISYAWAGCDPRRMGLGPVHAIAKLAQRSGLTPEDADIVEINEAFAAQVLAVLALLASADSGRAYGLTKSLGVPSSEILNPNGGAIALGHPVGASGARLVLTALKELQRRNGKRALVSLCIGGGQGGAAWLER